MLPYILVLVIAPGIVAVGLYWGVRILRVIRDQFDELMPQRMIDYSGFVDIGWPRD